MCKDDRADVWVVDPSVNEPDARIVNNHVSVGAFVGNVLDQFIGPRICEIGTIPTLTCKLIDEYNASV